MEGIKDVNTYLSITCLTRFTNRMLLAEKCISAPAIIEGCSSFFFVQARAEKLQHC